MSKSKKPRKKYDPMKAFKLAMNHAVFESWESEAECDHGVCRTNIATPILRDKIIATRRDWIVHQFVILDMPDEYEIRTIQQIYYDKLINQCSDDHKTLKNRLLDAYNPKLIADDGWILRPYSKRLGRKIAWDEDKMVKTAIDNKLLDLKFRELEKAG